MGNRKSLILKMFILCELFRNLLYPIHFDRHIDLLNNFGSIFSNLVNQWFKEYSQFLFCYSIYTSYHMDKEWYPVMTISGIISD